MPAAVPFFTKDNAKEYAKRGAYARWHAPKPPPQPLPQPEPNIDALRVYGRLQELDRLMAEAEEAKEWDQLSRAYDRLFRCWQVLSRTPGPGQLRPAQEGRRQARYWEKPVVMKPLPTIGSVPGDKPAA